MKYPPEFEIYLKPGRFTDSASPAVIDYAKTVTRNEDRDVDKAVALYYAIRDGFQYNPYHLDLRPQSLKASALLSRDYGYCVEKANLLAASARALGIPSRLGFANVKNHIATEKLEKILRTDVLVFHGYAELFLDGRWIKATPAFNRQLCEKLNVDPLEFDGTGDSMFQQYNREGGNFMEYLHDYGHFPDVPYDLFLQELKKHYPHVFEEQRRYEKKINIII
ncbi:transglutaminase [candidate division KSB1 bacterium]|nr:transglutaminase domain-containing protein [candidate division KSB1 bacterium]NIW73195.1 transglutaminase [candidate division KSB1 bacterium]